MKVLLVNPLFARIVGLEQDYIPLALLHISTILKQQGFEPYIKNLNMAEGLRYVNYLERNKKYDSLMDLYNSQKDIYYKELGHAIDRVNPDLIGFTVLTPQIKICNDLIQHVSINYSVPIFCGGAGATLNDDKITGCNLIFQGGINDLSVLNDINEYHNETFEDCTFSLENYDGNLNFSNILDDYKPDGYGHVFSSVGCYSNCRFCASPAIWKRKVYFKPITSFIRELKTIDYKFKPDKFLIWDENFTANNNRLKAFCSLYKLDQVWSCDSRISSLNETNIKMMKQHGCYQINLGVESGCQKTLDYLGKQIKTDDIKRVFSLLNKYSIDSKAYVIIGFPDETYNDMLESVEFIKSIKPDKVTLSLFTPYAHTEMYKECRDRGLIDDSYDESEVSHQSSKFFKKIHPEIDITKIIKMVDSINA